LSTLELPHHDPKTPIKDTLIFLNHKIKEDFYNDKNLFLQNDPDLTDEEPRTKPESKDDDEKDSSHVLHSTTNINDTYEMNDNTIFQDCKIDEWDNLDDNDTCTNFGTEESTNEFRKSN